MCLISLFAIAKLLPHEVIIDYFELTRHEIKEEQLHFTLLN